LGVSILKEATVAGVTALLTYFISNLVYEVFDFHYSVFENRFDLLLFLIDIGTYIVIFLLIFKMLTKIVVKGK
jgi:hypothetical protein